MKNLKSNVFFAGLSALLLMTSCEKDDDQPNTPAPPVNDQELITTVKLTFTNVNDTTEVLEAEWNDPDGPGGNQPVIDDIVLNNLTVYTVGIELLDASNPDDIEDITTEVEEEGAEHQLFFIPGTELENVLQITYADEDENGNPIGLTTTWSTTNNTSTSTIQVVLRHEPNKEDASVQQGDITNAGGETDVQIDFPVTIQ